MSTVFPLLSRLAAESGDMQVAATVLLLPLHNPVELAESIATLDCITGGRFVFGIGTGWLREESEIMGGDFDHRWTQTREALEVMKALWTQDEAEYHGHYFDFPAIKVFPKPAQKPHPPVFLGGAARNVLRRVVAHGDGWMPVRATPEDVRAARATLDELAESAGRDPKSIEICISGAADRDEIHRMEDAGATMATVSIPSSAPGEALPALEKMAEELLK
jgi:probable F420-dependent oxidoreductase